MTEGMVVGQLAEAAKHQEFGSRLMRAKVPVVHLFNPKAPANRQGIDVSVEAPSGKAFGVFDGVTVLWSKCAFL